MVLDLLLGIKVLHDKDYAHQDLKPGNILVNENNLSLTDLGSLEKHESKKEVLTTFEYLSPELAAGVRDKSIFNKIMCYGHMKNNYGDNVPSAFLLPHKANDMWALGVIIYEIYYGQRPTRLSDHLIQADPLLRGLLCSNREKRLTIDEALSLHTKLMNQKNEKVDLTRAQEAYQAVHHQWQEMGKNLQILYQELGAANKNNNKRKNEGHEEETPLKRRKFGV